MRARDSPPASAASIMTRFGCSQIEQDLAIYSAFRFDSLLPAAIVSLDCSLGSDLKIHHLGQDGGIVDARHQLDFWPRPDLATVNAKPPDCQASVFFVCHDPDGSPNGIGPHLHGVALQA